MRAILTLLFLSGISACAAAPAEDPVLPADEDDPCAMPDGSPADAECPQGCSRVDGECRMQRGIIVTD